jgi:hypothetical protein
LIFFSAKSVDPFDFGSNWAEAVGQSAYYLLQTEKRAGIVLILETMKGRKYWIRLNATTQHFNLPIDTWNVGKASLYQYPSLTTSDILCHILL